MPGSAPNGVRQALLRQLPRVLLTLFATVLPGSAALLSAPAFAHEMNLARYTLSVDASRTRIELGLSIPRDFAGPGTLDWPAGCSGSTGERREAGAFTRMRFVAECTQPLPPDASVGAPWGADGAVLTVRAADAGEPARTSMLAAGDAALRIPLGNAAGAPRSMLAVAGEYVRLGVVHILEGWDHLAFVLCLFLLARGRFLVWLITAFTIGHSLSLALAFLGVLRVPVPPTEAVIALSIAFMAREALLAGSREGFRADQHRVQQPDRRRAIAVVTGFGLLHGLGFASVLSGLGVAALERGTGLIAFNLGVELGQLLFVAALAGIGLGLRALGVHGYARSAALVLAGSLGVFWFLERILGFSDAALLI